MRVLGWKRNFGRRRIPKTSDSSSAALNHHVVWFDLRLAGERDETARKEFETQEGSKKEKYGERER